MATTPRVSLTRPPSVPYTPYSPLPHVANEDHTKFSALRVASDRSFQASMGTILKPSADNNTPRRSANETTGSAAGSLTKGVCLGTRGDVDRIGANTHSPNPLLLNFPGSGLSRGPRHSAARADERRRRQNPAPLHSKSGAPSSLKGGGQRQICSLTAALEHNQRQLEALRQTLRSISPKKSATTLKGVISDEVARSNDQNIAGKPVRRTTSVTSHAKTHSGASVDQRFPRTSLEPCVAPREKRLPTYLPEVIEAKRPSCTSALVGSVVEDERTRFLEELGEVQSKITNRIETCASEMPPVLFQQVLDASGVDGKLQALRASVKQLVRQVGVVTVAAGDVEDTKQFCQSTQCSGLQQALAEARANLSSAQDQLRRLRHLIGPLQRTVAVLGSNEMFERTPYSPFEAATTTDELSIENISEKSEAVGMAARHCEVRGAVSARAQLHGRSSEYAEVGCGRYPSEQGYSNFDVYPSNTGRSTSSVRPHETDDLPFDKKRTTSLRLNRMIGSPPQASLILGENSREAYHGPPSREHVLDDDAQPCEFESNEDVAWATTFLRDKYVSCGLNA